MVIVKLDDLARMVQDYVSVEDAPADMRPVRVMVNPAERGRIGLVVSSGEWVGDRGTQLVDFQNRRFHGVGGIGQ